MIFLLAFLVSVMAVDIFVARVAGIRDRVAHVVDSCFNASHDFICECQIVVLGCGALVVIYHLAAGDWKRTDYDYHKKHELRFTIVTITSYESNYDC